MVNMTWSDVSSSYQSEEHVWSDVYEHYRICTVPWNDTARQSAYQQLRAAIFVDQLRWDIPVDQQGRECDRYDHSPSSTRSVHCVYGIRREEAVLRDHEYLLGGVRIFQLYSWQDSMTAQEFRQTKMIPAYVIRALEKRYDPMKCLELTRFCVQRGRWHTPSALFAPADLPPPHRFNLALARDFTYAAVYHVAEQTQRYFALALVDDRYLRVMERSHFVFDEIYRRRYKHRLGYALAIIDLAATIRAIHASGDHLRAERMSILCLERSWLSLSEPPLFPLHSALEERSVHHVTRQDFTYKEPIYVSDTQI